MTLGKNQRGSRRPVNFFGILLILWIVPKIIGWDGLASFFFFLLIVCIIAIIAFVIYALVKAAKGESLFERDSSGTSGYSSRTNPGRQNRNPYSNTHRWGSAPSQPNKQDASQVKDVTYRETGYTGASSPTFTYSEPIPASAQNTGSAGTSSQAQDTQPGPGTPKAASQPVRQKITENRYFKLVVTDALLAAAAFILFSPHGIALTVGGGSVFRSVICIIFAVAIIAILIYTNFKYLYQPKTRILGEEEDKDLSSVLKGFHDKKVVGLYADTLLRQLQRGRTKEKNLDQLLETKFDKKSITYSKFSTVLSECVDTLAKNGLNLANEIQMFDSDEYLRLDSAIRSGSYKNDAVSDELQEKQYELMGQSLHHIQGGIDANEKLLMKLDEFQTEFSKLSIQDVDKRNEQIMAEIEELTKTAKYYQ